MNAARVLLLLILTMALSGCQAIMTIFEAGVWMGVIMVLLVLVVIGFIAARMRRP